MIQPSRSRCQGSVTAGLSGPLALSFCLAKKIDRRLVRTYQSQDGEIPLEDHRFSFLTMSGCVTGRARSRTPKRGAQDSLIVIDYMGSKEVLPAGCLPRAAVELSQEASRSMSARPSAKVGEMQIKLTGEQQKPSKSSTKIEEVGASRQGTLAKNLRNARL